MPSRRQYRLNRRVGQYAAAGGRRVKPQTVRMKSKCPGRLLNAGATAGDSTSFQLNNYNDPMGTGNTFTGKNTWHPENHEDLFALGYDKYLVLSANYRFDVHFRGTGTGGVQDFIFGYWFTKDADSFTFTPGTVTTDFWEKARVTPGFFWRDFSGNHSGGSIYPSAAPVVVNVPSVVAISKRLNSPSVSTEHSWIDYTGTLADNSSGSDNLAAYLNICVFNRYGATMTASDVQIDVTITQDCRFWQKVEAADFPEELDEHP